MNRILRRIVFVLVVVPIMVAAQIASALLFFPLLAFVCWVVGFERPIQEAWITATFPTLVMRDIWADPS